jgi:hypothetical protein
MLSIALNGDGAYGWWNEALSLANLPYPALSNRAESRLERERASANVTDLRPFLVADATPINRLPFSGVLGAPSS